MGKADEYRRQLRVLEEWEPYLLEHSGLPGPRGNIELATAVADEGTAELFQRLTAYSADRAPANDPHEFLAFCGLLGMGRMLAGGDRSVLPTLREHASDSRWRAREAVAMALQRWGREDMDGLLAEMQTWSGGTALEQRAAAAALCEPDLLKNPQHVARVLEILDSITDSLSQAEDRKSDGFKALRKGLGYCWSVAVAASPTAGTLAMERWLASDDRDLRWVMKQNLQKQRLTRMDQSWVQEKLAQLKE